jgi:hypothetical protein
VYTYIMSRRTQITFKDRQHRFLLEESVRTGLPMAELVRRAVDDVYTPGKRLKIAGWEWRGGVFREADPSIVGREVLPRKPRLSDDVY